MLKNLSSRFSILHPIDTLNSIVSYIPIKGKLIGESIFGQ